MFGWFNSKKANEVNDPQKVPTAKDAVRKEEEERDRLIRLEGEVYESLKYFSLKSDLKAIDDEMDKLEPQDTANNNKIEKFINENIKNPYRRETAAKLSGKKRTVLDRIAAFEAEQKAKEVDLSLGENAESLSAAIDELFRNDTNGLGRAMFGLRLGLDRSIVYENKNAALENVSSLLFGDATKISVLIEDLKSNYAYLGKSDPMNGENGALAVGLGTMTALFVLGTPISMAAGAVLGTADTILSVVTGSILPLCSVIGIASATVEAATAAFYVLSATAIGNGVIRSMKDEAAKKALQNLSLEDFVQLLALKATLVKEAKRNLDREAFKEVLDEHLRSVDDLRADAEYTWIVEKMDASKMSAKVTACNRFTERMAITVGI